MRWQIVGTSAPCVVRIVGAGENQSSKERVGIPNIDEMRENSESAFGPLRLDGASQARHHLPRRQILRS